MELWAAFFLGLAGSLHCAGMCGPLALAAPGAKGNPLAVVLGRVAYNVGRVVTYCLLGAAFGLAGRTLALIGIGRWLSLGAGMAILIVLAVSGRGRFNPWLARVASWGRLPRIIALRPGLCRLRHRGRNRRIAAGCGPHVDVRPGNDTDDAGDRSLRSETPTCAALTIPEVDSDRPCGLERAPNPARGSRPQGRSES